MAKTFRSPLGLGLHLVIVMLPLARGRLSWFFLVMSRIEWNQRGTCMILDNRDAIGESLLLVAKCPMELSAGGATPIGAGVWCWWIDEGRWPIVHLMARDLLQMGVTSWLNVTPNLRQTEPAQDNCVKAHSPFFHEPKIGRFLISTRWENNVHN
ncbi:hypothetical protein F5883DRAFT_515380 [Diaporthe sp. PMI_573]|nr:hypothetical protein F5883DRAFT_515380 [Diaporthaceae sp. PMI_573]